MKIDIIDLLRHNLMGIPLDVEISDEGKSHYEKYLTDMKEFFPPFSAKSTSEHIMWNVGGFYSYRLPLRHSLPIHSIYPY